jgi:hypothetical protein
VVTPSKITCWDLPQKFICFFNTVNYPLLFQKAHTHDRRHVGFSKSTTTAASSYASVFISLLVHNQ